MPQVSNKRQKRIELDEMSWSWAERCKSSSKELWFLGCSFCKAEGQPLPPLSCCHTPTHHWGHLLQNRCPGGMEFSRLRAAQLVPISTFTGILQKNSLLWFSHAAQSHPRWQRLLWGRRKTNSPFLGGVGRKTRDRTYLKVI